MKREPPRDYDFARELERDEGFEKSLFLREIWLLLALALLLLLREWWL